MGACDTRVTRLKVSKTGTTYFIDPLIHTSSSCGLKGITVCSREKEITPGRATGKKRTMARVCVTRTSASANLSRNELLKLGDYGLELMRNSYVPLRLTSTSRIAIIAR